MSEIVLLDTESDFDHIKCISIPFDKWVPEYYAISYRWGVHPEWKAQTPNYVASITSISQNNLIKLCKYYSHRIRYIWIDVVCINQADKNHRRMAIKNMDNIYRQSKRIIAVPDLCYCYENPQMVDVTEEDICLAISEISRNERIRQLSFDAICWNSFFSETQLEPIMSSKRTIFLRDVITEWATRSWVISERSIGVACDKLDIIILRGGAIMVPCMQWHYYVNIIWDVDFNPRTLIQTILNSKSTKLIDRLYAILPHTKYKDAVQKLVDQDRIINSMIDLKMTLLDILDIENKAELLWYMVSIDNDLAYMLPTFAGTKKFRLSAANYTTQRHYCNIEPTLKDGKHAIKISGFYTVKSHLKSIKPLRLKFETVIDILIASEDRLGQGGPWQRYLRCIKSDDTWIVQSIVYEESLRTTHCKRGEFVLFQ